MRSPRKLGLLVVLLFAGAAVPSACGEGSAPRSDVTPADVVAGRAQTFEHFESPRGKFAIDFPETWRGAYSAVAHADTTAGARFAVEFLFKPDPGSRVEPRTLLVVRIFSKKGWEAVAARPGPAIALKVAERGDDVFALQFPPSNPYKPGTPEAARFDELVLAVMQPAVPLRLTPR